MPTENQNSDFVARVKIDNTWYPIVGIASDKRGGIVRLSDSAGPSGVNDGIAVTPSALQDLSVNWTDKFSAQ